MSARAAWRLEGFGFTHVFRYTAGKIDWFAHGLPREGDAARATWVGDLVQPDMPTCRPMDRIGDVRKRIQDRGKDICVVVNDQRVVMGLLWGDALKANSDTSVEQVMECGPSTIRPNILPREAVKHMSDLGGDGVLVTTSDGVLLGLLRREDAERADSDKQ